MSALTQSTYIPVGRAQRPRTALGNSALQPSFALCPLRCQCVDVYIAPMSPGRAWVIGEITSALTALRRGAAAWSRPLLIASRLRSFPWKLARRYRFSPSPYVLQREFAFISVLVLAGSEQRGRCISRCIDRFSRVSILFTEDDELKSICRSGAL